MDLYERRALIVSSIKTKITSVPFSDPPQTGFLKLEKIDLLIVQVETKDGVIGTGHLHPLVGGLKTLQTLSLIHI